MKRKVYLAERTREEALDDFLAALTACGALQPGPPETLVTTAACGRVTAVPVFARNSSPHYNAAAMDGVAVRAEDTFGAMESSPKRLRLGVEAVIVDTGDPLPSQCNAVIMIEDVHFVDESTIEITSAAYPYQHVRPVGEDIVATEMIVPANHRLRPVDIGALLAGGVSEVQVHPRPRVALLPTGTELVEPGSELKPGDVIDFNTRVFAAMIEEWGGEAYRLPITPDNYHLLKERLLTALNEADIVLISAGSSAGREDFTADLIAELGEVRTHGVTIKPGKPVVLGIVQGKPVIGVPGYPVSAVLALELFLKPVLYRKTGTVPSQRPRLEAVVARKIVSTIGVDEFVRVKIGRVGDRYVAAPISRGAGVISSLVRADGIVVIPRAREGVQPGEKVEVELLRPLEEIKETTVIIGSHDLALDVLADYLRRYYPEATLSSAHVGSTAGLLALKRREAHAAGTHLLDEESGEYNVPYLKRILPDIPVVLINLVYREQGLIVARGNPKGIRNLEDLARPDVTFVNRQRGAGTRVLLDYHLRRLGIAPENIKGYEREEYTHMAVAAAVAGGTADVGLGIRAAAQALGLDFIPVGEERYDLCILKEFFPKPVIQRLLEVMARDEFRRAVAMLGGYDLRDCGRIMWES